MDPVVVTQLVWLGLLLFFALFEGITVGLTCIWFAVGSLAALICALADGPLWLQIVLFIVVSGLCLFAVRPIAKKHLNNKVIHTNADRIIGTVAVVTEEIENVQGKGAVCIGGITWTAKSEHNETIPVGTSVRVLRIEGVKVYVEKNKEEVTCQVKS